MYWEKRESNQLYDIIYNFEYFIGIGLEEGIKEINFEKVGSLQNAETKGLLEVLGKAVLINAEVENVILNV